VSKLYDCDGCLAFCCTVYDRLKITPHDAKRLAAHLGIKLKAFVKRYTVEDLLLARKDDPPLGKACVFLDAGERRCTVYEARPDICRDWPRPQHAVPGAEGRCCYYDVQQYAKKELGATAVPLVQIIHVKGA